MADFRFSCPQCGQEIECDELWSGHQIQCPTCQGEITVPPKPDAPPHASFASAAPRESRLSIGQSRAQRSSAPPPPPPQEVLLQRQLKQAKTGRQGSGAMKWVGVGAVVIALGVGGYFGYGYYNEWQAKRAEAAKQASAPPPATNAAPAAPAPPKELPVLPAVWTLEVEKASIPDGKANGMFAGTNFVPEIARLAKVSTAYALQFAQGPAASPDQELLIYLYPDAGEGVTGRTWTVSKEMKGKGVPQVMKLWKTDPRYRAQQKTYSTGYAMKLELGQITNGVVPGKIFLALPDTEQSVIAGEFKAATTLADANGATAANPVVAPGPANPRAAPGNPAFQRRYGGKR